MQTLCIDIVVLFSRQSDRAEAYSWFRELKKSDLFEHSRNVVFAKSKWFTVHYFCHAFDAILSSMSRFKCRCLQNRPCHRAQNKLPLSVILKQLSSSQSMLAYEHTLIYVDAIHCSVTSLLPNRPFRWNFLCLRNNNENIAVFLMTHTTFVVVWHYL